MAKPASKPPSAPLYDAVVAGYLGVDIAPGFASNQKAGKFSDLFRPGTIVEMSGLSISLGGTVANTGLAMKRFGGNVQLMGCVGKDALGDMVLSKLEEAGVTKGIVCTSRAGTSYGIVIAPPGCDRMFLEDPGCNGIFGSKEIDYKVVAASRLFHLGYPSLMTRLWRDNGAELLKIYTRVSKLGVATSLDLALPDSSSSASRADWRAILAATLPYVDIFLPSVEELLFMLEPKEYARLLAEANGGDIIDLIPRELYDILGDRILALGVNVLMIKAGHRGAYLRTGNIEALHARTTLRPPLESWKDRTLWIDPRQVDTVRFQNASGAGDCTIAAFLTALLDGAEIEQAGRLAMLAGRDNLYGVDALSGLSSWKKMIASVRAS